MTYVNEFHRGKWILHKNRTQDLFEIVFYGVCNHKIVFAHFNDFKLDILAKDRKLLHRITRDIKKIPFTAKDRAKVIDFWKRNPDFKTNYKLWEKRTIWPKTFPAIFACRVSDNKIYIITYLRKDNESECFIYDFAGKFIRKVFIPLKINSPFMKDYPFNVYKDTLWQLVDNPDTDEWDLHTNVI